MSEPRSRADDFGESTYLQLDGCASPPPMLKTATISPCGTYRYDLTRHWGESPPVLWVMLNPSTADADIDDPTIRRCIGFTRAWGYSSLAVVNLFAYRSTDPKALRTAHDPGGPENVDHIDRWVERCAFGVAAWGAYSDPPASKKRRGIEAMFRLADKNLFCLGTTKDGSPRHPLYVRGDMPLMSYNPKEGL